MITIQGQQTPRTQCYGEGLQQVLLLQPLGCNQEMDECLWSSERSVMVRPIVG